MWPLIYITRYACFALFEKSPSNPKTHISDIFLEDANGEGLGRADAVIDRLDPDVRQAVVVEGRDGMDEVARPPQPQLLLECAARRLVVGPLPEQAIQADAEDAGAHELVGGGGRELAAGAALEVVVADEGVVDLEEGFAGRVLAHLGTLLAERNGIWTKSKRKPNKVNIKIFQE